MHQHPGSASMAQTKCARRTFGLHILRALGCFLLVGWSGGTRELTFEDRVRAQEAIDRLYYSHQTGVTRPVEESVLRRVSERKVRTYLKQTVALDLFWKTRVTPEMLHRELERMAGHTRMPERLVQLY